MKIRLVNFLDTDVILDRLEAECRKAGLTIRELWRRIQLEERTMDRWRLGQNTPSLLSLQHIQEVINTHIRETNPGAEFENAS